jgi:hypothetical protein
LPFTSESLSNSEDTLESADIRPDRGRGDIIRGVLDVSGDLNFEQKASGLGMLLRVALGDYVKAPQCDGGVRGRLQRDGVITVVVPADTDGGDRYLLPFAKDHTSGFAEDGGKFAVVYRNGTNDLVFTDNAGAGFDYDSYAPAATTYALEINDNNTNYSTSSATPDGVVQIKLASVLDVNGEQVAPKFNPNGGVVYLGKDRREFYYFEYNPDDAGEHVMYIAKELPHSAADIEALEAIVALYNSGTGIWAEHVFVLGTAGLANTGAFSFGVGVDIKKGQWLYEFGGADYAGVFTHHIERGRRLRVSLTIEIDRDVVVFKYGGCKVDTLDLSFEAQSIVTGTFSLVCQSEASVATLLADVLPGDTSIRIDDATAFPVPTDVGGKAMLTIGEETEIFYTGKTWDSATDSWILSGIESDTSDVASIQHPHLKGSQVDSRTSGKFNNVHVGSDRSLSSFEIGIFIDGYFEEAMAASLTLNNNLDPDKYPLGSRHRAFSVEGRAEVEGSLTMEFDDGKHYRKFISGEEFSLEVRAMGETVADLIANTSIPPQAIYFAPRCKYNGETANISDDSIINVDMPFMAMTDNAHNTTDLIITLVNGHEWDVEANPAIT